MKNLIKKFWLVKVLTLFVIMVLVFTNKNVYSQVVNIPDVQLKNRLINHDPVIDLNHNHQIEYSEAAAFTGTLNISGGSSQIINLTGLETFSGITRLYMGSNSVHNSWSFWGNTALQQLFCENNYLTTIDVSQNTNLTLLNCMNNDITNLILTGNPSLTTLYCDGNQLTSLTLYLNSNLSILYCSNNPLTNLDLSQNTNLTVLYCTQNPSLPVLDLSENTDLTELNCSSNLWDTLNISANTNLITLDCSNNHLKKLDITHNEFLVTLNCNYNQMSSLILGPNWSLKYLFCHHNELRNMNTSFCTALVSLYCQNNSIYGLDLHNNTHLQVLSAYNNQLRYLNMKNGSNTNISNSAFQVWGNENLTCIQVDNPEWAINHWFNKPPGASYSLNCPNCIVNIPSLNFKYTLLRDSSINFNWDNEIQTYEAAEYTGEINVSWKQINDLTGIEAFTSIYSLKCNVNDLTSLQLAANTSIIYLDCSSNPITNLNVSGSSSLTSFNCQYNNLTSLNVKNGNNTNFTYFNAKNSPNLSCIQVDDVAWSTLHWTVANGNIDPGVQFDLTCACAQFSASASVISDVNCYGGSDGSATATAVGGTPPYLFLWSNGETSQTIIDLAEGTYSVNIVDNNNCEAGNSVTILQPELLYVSAIGTDVSCYGGSDGSATVVVEGGIPPYEFLWDNNVATQDILDLVSGDYEVSVSDANGCTKTDIVSIGQPPLLISDTSISICNTDSVYLQQAWRKISGIYQDTLLSTNGCDSIIVTNLTVAQCAVLTVLPNTLNIGPDVGSTATFDITSNIAWTVGCDQTWLTANTAGGSNNATITLTAIANPTITTRTATVTVSGTGATAQTVTVTFNLVGHNIELAGGWSGLSSYVNPLSDNIEIMFNDIISGLVILQNASGMYWPGQNMNTLGTWNTHEGYQIKVANAVELTISGLCENNKTLQLAAGWNLIPVLSSSPYNIVNLFSGVPGFTIAKDVAGSGVYWKAFGINTIGYVQPGKAYYVRMNSAGSIDYSIASDNSSQGKRGEITTLSTPWNAVVNTPASHLVAFNLENNSFQTGDVVGGFTQEGWCAGAVGITDPSVPFALNLNGDDAYSADKDGFETGEILKYRLYRPSIGEIFDLEVTYNTEMNTGNFENNGLSEVTSIKMSVIGYSEQTDGKVKILPNPSCGIFRIDGLNTDAKVSIFNLFGGLVFSNQMMLPVEIKFEGNKAGVYFIKVETENGFFSEKLIVQ